MVCLGKLLKPFIMQNGFNTQPVKIKNHSSKEQHKNQIKQPFCPHYQQEKVLQGSIIIT
jgi:hypothetical protein